MPGYPVQFKSYEVAALKRMRASGNEAAKAVLECWSVDWPEIHGACAAAALMEDDGVELPSSVLQKLMDVGTDREIILGTIAMNEGVKLPAVYRDKFHNNCLLLGIMEGTARIISRENGPYDLLEVPAASFLERFGPLTDYNPTQAAQIYIKYARYLGATEPAIKELAKLVPLNEQERNIMSGVKKATAKATPPVVAKGKKLTKKQETEAIEAEVVAEPATESKWTKKAKAKEAAAEKTPRRSAAQAFMQLIREQKLTDDEIFAAVQSEFGLDDKKRSYVAWYRNYMKKKLNEDCPPVER